jgi:hypothetical protein
MPFQKGYKRAPTSGRKPGVLNKNTAEIKTLAMKDVPRVVHELVRLALQAKNEATRVAACKELLDRAIGKAIQPRAGESGEGPVIVQVVTGVPRSGELTNAAFSSVMPANPSIGNSALTFPMASHSALCRPPRLWRGMGLSNNRQSAAKALPLANRAPKLRLKLAAASRLSITIKSLSCRLRPDAEKFAAPVRSNRPSIS